MEAMDSPHLPLTPKKPTTPASRLVVSRSPAEKKDLTPKTRLLSSTTISSLPLSSSPSPSPSSSSSSFSTINTASCPQPSSPFTHPYPSNSLSSVPFSWESQPGIPKTSPAKPTSPEPALPPPPVLQRRSPKHNRRRRPNKSSIDCDDVDPFTVALMQCSKDKEEVADDHRKTPAKKVDRRRRASFGLMPRTFDLYASCKSTSSVADSCIYARRPGHCSKPMMPARRTGSSHAGRSS